VVGWTNPPHRSHLCHVCDLIWRPADVPTVGVAAIATRGADDSPSELAERPSAQEPVDQSTITLSGEHGSQKVKCPHCDNAELEAENERLREKLADWENYGEGAAARARARDATIAALEKRYAESESRLAFCDGALQTVQVELAALKARIAGAPVFVAVEAMICEEEGERAAAQIDLPADMIGKRVRLLIVGDEG
jgi:hypothetical protein